MSFISDTLPWIQAAATAFVPVAITVAGMIAQRRGVNSDVIAASQRGAGVAYTAMLATGRPLNDPAVMAIGIRAASDYMLTMVPDKVVSAGLDPRAVETLAHAQIGLLLAPVTPVKPV